MRKSAPQPETRKTPTGGTVGVGVSDGWKEGGDGERTEYCYDDQEECFYHFGGCRLSFSCMMIECDDRVWCYRR